MIQPKPTILSTVSGQFIDDWLVALRALCREDNFASLLQRAGLSAGHWQSHSRVTLDQIVGLYQSAAVETGDEMMGLWSRPIRPRALQHLLTTLREATSLPSALYRFSTFWNLLLDEYQFDLTETDSALILTLRPLTDVPAQRFGHMLILKLAHGLMSWLAGHEVPVTVVGFAFARPDFHADYPIIFPAPLRFDQAATSITFDPRALGRVKARSAADMDHFLKNAPRDWIFTQSREHTQSLRVRRHLGQIPWEAATLTQVAPALNMTPRTLIRRLERDGTAFQTIKDGLRRDIAIRDLQDGRKSVDQIALDVGFSSSANFYKAFRRWTGTTPGTYRQS